MAGFLICMFVSVTAQAATEPLVGTWQGTPRMSNGGGYWTLTETFNSDNTWYSTDITSDGKVSASQSGTYSYSSTTITATVVTSACTGFIDGNALTGCDPAGTTDTLTYAISGSGIGSTVVITHADGTTSTLTKISEPQLPVTPPTCTLTASPASITPGGISTLTVSCNPAATSYTWSGGTCVGDTGATCTVTPSVTTTYSVAGSNASGTGNSASATVTPFAVQATVANNVVQASITYNSADLDQTGKVYIFGYLPANSPLFGGVVRSSLQGNELATGNLVPAMLTASGWQQILSGGTVEPAYTGTLNSSNSAFALYVAGLFNQSSDAGIICAAYTTSTNVNATDQGLPVVTGNDPTVTCPSVTLVTLVIEFYNTNLDNYFITANAGEAAAIDGGSAGPGWIRTGNTFKSGDSTSVCRFYGSMSPGPNSHFYTADAGECAYLKQLQATTPDTEKRWNFESLDFLTTLPTVAGINGACPTGTTPIYRAYNNGFARGVDSNHRIASSQAAIQQEVARGWNDEGVVMCAPQ